MTVPQYNEELGDKGFTVLEDGDKIAVLLTREKFDFINKMIEGYNQSAIHKVPTIN